MDITKPKPATAPAVSRHSLVDRTLATLRQCIESGDWAVGMRIPCEADLVAQLGVSRTTVREAVRALSQSGVLEVRQGDGTYVRRRDDPMEIMRRLDHAAFRDHHELRCILNAECGRLAARRRDENDIVRLGILLAERGDGRNAPSLAELALRDQAFHMAIAEATKNRALVEMYRYFATDDAAMMELTLTGTVNQLDAFRQHQELLQAIIDGDEEAAVQATHDIVNPIVEHFDRQLQVESNGV